MADRDNATPTPDDDLVGRADERAALIRLVTSVGSGRSEVLVVRGDAGIGKTALLDHLSRVSNGLATIRLGGAEAESNLPFAAIQRLAHSAGSIQDSLPIPQREALRVAIGIAAGPPPDRFLIGLAVRTLLEDLARDRPFLLLVDDAQWLDQESIDALAFAARRLDHERVGMVIGHRRDPSVNAFDGFPVLEIEGLAAADALSLLRRVVTRRLDRRISDQIVTATGGNPLAIIDLAQELSTHQLVGLTLLPEPLPVGSHLEAHYLRQATAFPADVQTWLLLAAAEPTGDPAYVASAAAVLGIDVHAADLAEAANLVTIGASIEFRHPLVRSAIYTGAAGGQRRRVHNALAAVIRRKRDVDRRAWHLAAGCVGTDEEVAGLLEQAAERARERGGYSARASFLARAVELSPEGEGRIERSLAAAEAALMAGRGVQAIAILDNAGIDSADEVNSGRSLMIRGSALAFTGQAGAMAAVPAICAAAADAFASTSPVLARDALLTAFERALSSEWLTEGISLTDLAVRASRLDLAEPSIPNLMLAGLASLVADPFPTAQPRLRAAVDALRDSDAPLAEILLWGSLSVALTTALWDDRARNHILVQAVDAARDSGALHVLDQLLFILSVSETVMGQLDSAARYLDELSQVRDALGMTPAQQEMFRNAEYLGWRGGDGTVRGAIEATRPAAIYLGIGGAETLARTGFLVLDIAAGDYESAYSIAKKIHDFDFMQISIRVLPDLVEAATRSGRRDQARAALAELAVVAQACGTDWGLGVLERSRGVLAEADGDPAGHYQAATEHLARTRARADLARTHLLWGEWLRRKKRRRDARIELGIALDHFQDMGAASFAARARRELAATGAPRLSDSGESHDGKTVLTPQEQAVARLAAAGATNAEIALALVVSRHTIDYHLRKVYQKLGVSSRRQLAAALDHSPD